MTPTTPSPIADQAAGEQDTIVKDLRSYARIMRTKEDNQHCIDRDCADAAEQMEWAALRIEGLEHQISKQVPGDADYPGTNADIIEKALYCNLHGDTESVENWLNHLRDRITAPTAGSAPEPAAWMNPNEPYSRDAFLWARDEDCSPEYSVPVYAAPASPAASMLSEDAILAIAIDHGLGTAVVESIAKALLAASAGGDRTATPPASEA